MDMSTPSTAHTLDGVGVPTAGEATVIPDGRERGELGEENVTDSLGSMKEVPMQFVRLGLPVAILLWFLIGLFAYGAYRFVAG
jgi:hypothetical protein